MRNHSLKNAKPEHPFGVFPYVDKNPSSPAKAPPFPLVLRLFRAPPFPLITFQKRNLKTNVAIIFFPILLCVLLADIQGIIDRELEKQKNRCGCACVNSGADNDSCHHLCGIQYSTLDQVGFYPITSPPRWPVLLQVPRPEYMHRRRVSHFPLPCRMSHAGPTVHVPPPYSSPARIEFLLSVWRGIFLGKLLLWTPLII